MIVIDTSAWIEWLIASPTGTVLGGILPDRDDWLVPTIVQLELAKWLTREVGSDKADEVVAFIQTCIVAPLDTSIALLGAELCAKHTLAAADAIVYATATEYRAELLTCDAHFHGLPGVTFIAKGKS